MQRLNRYYRRSRITEAKFRLLIRHFALDLCASNAAQLTGLSQIQGGEELAGAVDLDKMDVQAYSDICICYFRYHGRLYYKYIYCWQHCP